MLLIVKVTVACLVTSMEVIISNICIKTVIAKCGIWTSPQQIATISHDKIILSKRFRYRHVQINQPREISVKNSPSTTL